MRKVEEDHLGSSTGCSISFPNPLQTNPCSPISSYVGDPQSFFKFFTSEKSLLMADPFRGRGRKFLKAKLLEHHVESFSSTLTSPQSVF